MTITLIIHLTSRMDYSKVSNSQDARPPSCTTDHPNVYPAWNGIGKPSGAPFRSRFAPNLDFNSNTIHIEEHLCPGQPEQTKLVIYLWQIMVGLLLAPSCCIHLPWHNHLPINNTISPRVHLQSQGQGACDHSQNPSPRQVVQDEIEANVLL